MEQDQAKKENNASYLSENREAELPILQIQYGHVIGYYQPSVK
jgi:hypothetical protein